MVKEKYPAKSAYELDDDDKAQISEIFFKRITPKLIRLGARSGNLCCEFAGEKYKNWMIRFRPNGSAFDIVEFEYDEDGADIDLDL
ncbi:MAG: hypothetical protein JW882_16250 [Deltaproteobacteria bacterium]|nr:hypothetical protein [Deltaproteobacteria bacterium]